MRMHRYVTGEIITGKCSNAYSLDIMTTSYLLECSWQPRILESNQAYRDL